MENLILPRLYPLRIYQHSKTITQAWSGNIDLQLIIYQSDHNIPDIQEIEGVSKYGTLHARKTHQTTKQKVNTI